MKQVGVFVLGCLARILSITMSLNKDRKEVQLKLDREINHRLNIFEWLQSVKGISADEALHILVKFKLNNEAIQHSFDIPNEVIFAYD